MTSDTSSDEDEDQSASFDPSVANAVKAALRAANMADSDDEDDEAKDDDEESDEQSDLDDEQMLALDEKLAEIFKLQSSSKKSSEAAKTEAVAAKTRLLDLLDAFAKSQPGNEHLIWCFVPLLGLARDSQKADPQLSNKVISLLQNRICKAKEPLALTTDETRSAALEALGKVHEETQLKALHSAMSVYLTKSLLAGQHKATLDECRQIYRDALVDFAQKKSSSVHPAVLQEAFKRFPQMAWAIREEILSACRAEQNSSAFKRVQAFTFLQAMLTQQVPALVKVRLDAKLTSVVCVFS